MDTQGLELQRKSAGDQWITDFNIMVSGHHHTHPTRDDKRP